jgi:hypothetical protein
MCFNSTGVERATDLLHPTYYSIQDVIANVVVDVSGEGRRWLATEERRETRDAAVKRRHSKSSMLSSTTSSRGRRKGEGDDSSSLASRVGAAAEDDVSDSSLADLDMSHYAQDLSDRVIKKTLRDIDDLQVSILCALDTIVLSSFRDEKRTSHVEELPLLALPLRGFRRRVSAYLRELVHNANHEHVACEHSARAFFTFQYFTLVNRLTATSREYSWDIVEHNFTDFR